MPDSARTKVKISNRLGMHARPAMMFVNAASEFTCTIRVRRTDTPDEDFDGKSIMQMMMLAATCGTEIEITADGHDAKKAVKCLVELINCGFDEE